MQHNTLRDVLSPRIEDSGTLRWRTTVPIATNPLLLIELFQIAFVGASIVVLILCTGVWVMEGGIAVTDIITSLQFAAMVLLASIVGFISIAVLFFRNKYYALYHMDFTGIFHEGTRGNDERKTRLCLQFCPFPVVGNVQAKHSRSQHLPWNKVDRFQSFASMRVIVLQRGRWHMLRLYTPDTVTYIKVVQYLEKRLRQI